MAYNKFMNDRLQAVLDEAIAERVSPGASLAIFKNGKRFELSAGRLTYNETSPKVTPQTVYDVASITKSVPVSCLLLQLIEQGKLKLDEPVINHIPELQQPDRDKILIKHLLTYTAIWDLPHGLSYFAKQGAEAVMQAIYTSPLLAEPGARYWYTNPPAILMGLIAERVTGKTLDSLADDEFFKPLGMTSTTFYPEKLHNVEIAPTEVDWRGEMKGLVHDEAAWALRGADVLSGHAGLFSTAGDLLTFAEMLLGGGEWQRYFTPQTIAQMHTNQTAQLDARTGLGWEINLDGFGQHASTQAFGKTGFTGTFICIDPAKNTAFVLLSNSTYPQRPANRDAINRVRAAVADVLFR